MVRATAARSQPAAMGRLVMVAAVMAAHATVRHAMAAAVMAAHATAHHAMAAAVMVRRVRAANRGCSPGFALVFIRVKRLMQAVMGVATAHHATVQATTRLHAMVRRVMAAHATAHHAMAAVVSVALATVHHAMVRAMGFCRLTQAIPAMEAHLPTMKVRLRFITMPHRSTMAA